MEKKLEYIKVRNAEKTDCDDIFIWRNDEFTRKMSHTSEIVDLDKHSEWYFNSLNLESRVLLLCENSYNEKIASVTFDISEQKAVISINLNPTQRGKGLGRFCLIKSIEFFSREFPEIKNLQAEIKNENIASKKIFLAFGFKKYNTKGNIGFYKKILV